MASNEFVDKHRTSKTAFTRDRKLSFFDVFVLIFRKGVKSLQLMLNEFTLQMAKRETVTASAFSQARSKLKHTAFVELNDDIVEMYYSEREIKRYKGLRILGFDASKITLPKNEETKSEFGSKPIGNHTGKELGEYCGATFESCYDVLNNIAVKSLLSRTDAYEVTLASQMLGDIKEDDLLIFDRGYASYEFISELNKRNLNYIIRCSESCFSAVKNMFSLDFSDDVTTEITVPAGKAKRLRSAGVPEKQKVRVVRVFLPSGEIEVLITSLFDNREFLCDDFKKMYFMRWGVETFFGKLKGRLNLENFTGKSVESIKQDFWSTIFISNLETILTEDVQSDLDKKNDSEKPRKTINHAVSFNAIKNMAFEILSSSANEEDTFEKLMRLFTLNLNTVRNWRTSPRIKISDTKSMNYQKLRRKHVF